MEKRFLRSRRLIKREEGRGERDERKDDDNNDKNYNNEKKKKTKGEDLNIYLSFSFRIDSLIIY